VGVEPAGTFCLVLHTHLPWVAHAGAWPVGEEWLHQAFTGSWRRVIRVLETLAEEGHREIVTLGVTPVVAAMLDDPYCLRQMHTWAGFWRLRAEGLADRREPWAAELAASEFRAAEDCLEDLEGRWLTGGGSSVLRPLIDERVVEYLGGPAAHPFQPLLPDRLVRFSLEAGLDDATLRLGSRPEGIWAPECGYRPGLEQVYAQEGVRRFLVDGPSLHGDTSQAHPVADTDVVAFGRDLEVTYRVWSPKAGYPGGRWYRDFHHFDHPSGFKPSRVTSRSSDDKRPWEPEAARSAAYADAEDFVSVVRRRLDELRERDGRPGLVVAAYDTELFGHHWYEGPDWLAHVLRLLPEAGVRVTTLAGALQEGHLGPAVELPAGSWGTGKDWRVWDGAQVSDLVSEGKRVVHRLFQVHEWLASRGGPSAGLSRSPALDQLASEALLHLSSDWAFMVTKDSAAAYARGRAETHAARFDRLADLLQTAHPTAAAAYAAGLAEVDRPFGHLDARRL